MKPLTALRPGTGPFGHAPLAATDLRPLALRPGRRGAGLTAIARAFRPELAAFRPPVSYTETIHEKRKDARKDHRGRGGRARACYVSALRCRSAVTPAEEH